jgi:hypothetical protein
MKSFIQFIKESTSETMSFDEVIEWMKNLDLNKKVPAGMSKESKLLKYIENQLKVYDEIKGNSSITDGIVKNVLRVVNDDFKGKREIITDKFGIKQAEPLVIVGNYATYHKADKSAYSKFKENVKNIEEFLGTLTGYHTIPLKNLVIKFATMKTGGSYKTADDELWINSTKAGNTLERYGSLRYVVLHELGHRYLRIKSQRWDIDDVSWITTKYSATDSWNGEEKFAELFAITHWPEQYPEYDETMKLFKKKIQQ